jgi:hypothetical protein
MNVVTLVRRYGLWLAMALLMSLPGATMSGCLPDPPPAAGISAAGTSDEVAPLTSSPTPLSCPPCPLARVEPGSGPVIATACDCSHCGDGICNFGETHATCSPDCPLTSPGPVCGNGICESGETASSCPRDCAAVCGNGRCEVGEATTCPQDCCGRATPPCTL